MDTARFKQIQKGLQDASAGYMAAAQDEMHASFGSAHNVYAFIKESYSIEGKARNLSRRWGINPCNCEDA